MRWNEQVFAYCERGANAAFWAEPLNAVTNAAFFVTAILAFRLWRREARRGAGGDELLLILLVVLIGLGSFLFHTFATRWAAIADTVPIGIFMVGYLGYALRRYVNLGWIATFAGLVVFFIALWQSSVVRCGAGPCLQGSVAYVPAFLALLGIGGWLMVKRHPAGPALVMGGLLFAVSLSLRTLDQQVCPYTVLVASRPFGTHFLWHVLNATLLYILLRAAILHGPRRLPT